MSDTNTYDVSHAKFSCTVNPSEDDVHLWSSLSDEEKEAVIDRELAQAEESGIADPEDMASRIERVRKTMSA